MKSIFVLFVVVQVALAGACSAITDFPESRLNQDPDTADSDSQGAPYSLKDNLKGAVTVTVKGAAGSIDVGLTKPLPAEADVETVKDLLDDGSLTLIVENAETGVTFDLTDGVLVEAKPSKEGQYRVVVNKARDAVEVEFYNAFDGHSIQVGGAYQAAFEVLSNAYFKAETFAVNVTVVGS